MSKKISVREVHNPGDTHDHAELTGSEIPTINGGFKRGLDISSPDTSFRWDNTSTPNFIYLGSSYLGALDTDSSWKVSRVDLLNGSIKYANGNAQYINQWSNRTGLTYV